MPKGQWTKTRPVNCALCGAPFMTRFSRGKYCSPKCAHEGFKAHDRDAKARERQNYPQRVASRKAAQSKTPRARAVAMVAHKRHWARHPEKRAARGAVSSAVQRGTLKKQPCVRCGAPKTQAHHHDYSKPLDVTWLCPPCHRLEHPHGRVAGQTTTGGE